MKRQSEKQKIRSVHDYWFLTLIMLRDRRCFYPGCTKQIYTGHHIFQKGSSYLHLRFDPVNGIGTCLTHHGPWHGVHSAPQAYEPIIKQAVNRIHGAGAYEGLEARAYMQRGGLPDPVLLEIELTQGLRQYGYELPEGWGEWKAYKKIAWLKEIRKRLLNG